MGNRRGRGISRVWGYGGVAVLAGAVLVLAGVALGEARSEAPANAGSVPSLPTTSPPAAAEQTRLTAWTTDEVRAAIASGDDLVISVLGDSTGVGPDRWVSLYAQHLAENATVTLHPWDGVTESYSPAKTFGRGARTIEIWNGSFTGSNYEYAMTRLDALQPVTPTLVIGNYGHNQGRQPINQGYTDLIGAMQAKTGAPVPFVATIQNSARGDRAAISKKAEDLMEMWVAGRDVPYVDIRKAFGDQTDALLQDDVHPQPCGIAPLG